jgi:GT2 family glycosyltransferase
MAERPTIGVVTVTYNSAKVLSDFLRCTSAQTYQNILIYAVDNASQDSTLELLRACDDSRLKVIANPDNRGVAEGNNQGIQAALEDGCGLVLLINNDTEFDPRLFESLADGLYEHNCDMACPKILYFDEPTRIWAAGGYFQPLLGYRSRHFGEGAFDCGQFDRVRRITYVPTCCVLIRNEVFSSVGMMDPRYFVYVDDVDFMYRAMKASKSLIYLPHSRVLHKVGHLTGGSESVFSIRYGTWNIVYFLLKNFGLVRAVPALSIYQVYYLLSLVTFKFSARKYRMKQRAFWEGFQMGRSS